MENKYEIYRRLFDNINKNTQLEDMNNYEVNESAFEKDFNNILALKSVQNTTLDDYIKVKPQIDSVTRRKYTLIFLSQVYNMWKESMELVDTDDEEDEEVKTSRGGGFFTKKKTRKKRKKQSHKKQSHKKQSRKKQSHKKQSHKKQTRKKKDIKFTDTSYPYRNISNQEAINDFLALKKIVQGTINPRSISGNKTVDWGTEKARRKTKYRNKSFIEMWDNKERRGKMLEFAKRLKKKQPNRSIVSSIRSAIDLQWGTVNTMRAAAAAQMYKKYGATRVLDFTAGWGARMIAAMALDIDYIGIDTNEELRSGYENIIKLLKPYTKSTVKMIWKEAQDVDYSKLGKYDYVFTSPPYEYLEAYENMTNYENKGDKIKQPSSSQTIKMDDSAKFYDEFLVPTLKKAYKYLPKNKFICLNIPDIMYDKIKKRWKSVTKKETYQIIKRTGGPVGKDRRGKELIFCWKKR
uniref:site-specific DNA-methyltransferase (cytosine-N(4)-specific) n=1 Tax=viral metagenome TaxID=1070528 RepID=A0A6C0JCU3_9ZZZZ